ncbi:MAG: DUF1887 family CARF protein [Desulfuromonadaceae bacterium]|nr:DUF1887 family CARF protein [Desulfuromonadaceae bacterium]MDD2855884.1 DUF1887 family CARF protein [Desulfuromonadaceae bacterium]
MNSAHVIIVSAQPIPNLIPIISAMPATVHLLVSDKMDLQSVRLIRFLEERNIRCVGHSINPYNMGQVETVCRGILENTEAGSITLNATGGTKIAAFGAFAAFRELGFPIIYFDPEKWRMIRLDVNGQPPEKAEAELNVSDYLSLHGFKVSSDAGDDETVLERRNLTDWLSKNLPESGLMPILNQFASEAQEKKIFPFVKNIMGYFNSSFIGVLKKLASENIIGWDSKTRAITFPTIDAARYIGGFWLEEYVFDVVKSLGVHDVRRNVNVVWDGSGIKNEFDVVFTHKCRLFLISCKTSKLGHEKQYKDKNPVYELDSLKDAAAGLFGQGVLVSASPLGGELKKRADTLRLVSINAEEIKWLATKLKIELK